ncbi:hypothetical protein YC2023_038743 [Brassica napus]
MDSQSKVEDHGNMDSKGEILYRSLDTPGSKVALPLTLLENEEERDCSLLITFFKFLVKKERHQSVFDWLLETSKYTSRELLNQRKQMPCHISHPNIKIFITETNKKNKKVGIVSRVTKKFRYLETTCFPHNNNNSIQVVEASQPHEEDSLLSGNPIDTQSEEHHCDTRIIDDVAIPAMNYQSIKNTRRSSPSRDSSSFLF